MDKEVEKLLIKVGFIFAESLNMWILEKKHHVYYKSNIYEYICVPNINLPVEYIDFKNAKDFILYIKKIFKHILRKQKIDFLCTKM